VGDSPAYQDQRAFMAADCPKSDDPFISPYRLICPVFIDSGLRQLPRLFELDGQPDENVISNTAGLCYTCDIYCKLLLSQWEGLWQRAMQQHHHRVQLMLCLRSSLHVFRIMFHQRSHFKRVVYRSHMERSRLRPILP
jgi:hypothetical protein